MVETSKRLKGAIDMHIHSAQMYGREKTMTWKILKAHNHSNTMEDLQLVFDALVSPDNNYVSILQTARASGLKKFPVPYVLSNCHNSLCAVGGTINEDDHVFGLGNAVKYGGIFVPPYKAVIHQYMREMMAGCGKMILGSDSHTRYGVLGTMGIGEGGGEIAKQLLKKTYDIPYPKVIAVKLTGTPKPGVGPQDVALALIAATFKNGFNKNKVLEFVGDGISNLSVEYRMGIDVMTTESAALSSIWCTDEKVREYLKLHGREEEYKEMMPEAGACYDSLIEIDLSQVECMIALPYHPSNAVPISYFKEHMEELLKEVEEEGRKIKGDNGKPFSIMSHIHDGGFYVDQALVSGCSGGMFENISAMADILDGYSISGDQCSLGVNPSSMPIMAEMMDQGIAKQLMLSGATIRPAICGPCFGVTDVPADNQVSIRHTTRNYPNREGSKPAKGQMAAAFLMDARSIAATVRNGGRLTAATELEVEYTDRKAGFDRSIYEKQVYNNYGKEKRSTELKMGPNIADWPEMFPLKKHLLLKTVGVYEGSLTTDELVPSGDASSYRSNPEKLAEFTLCSRDPEYVKRAMAVRETARQQEAGQKLSDQEMDGLLEQIAAKYGADLKKISIGSLLAGEKIGDGSSREQAASSQKVLGGWADLAEEYSTKRYRSNLINWGILPLITKEPLVVKNGDVVLIQDIETVLKDGREELTAYLLDEKTGETKKEIPCSLGRLTAEERKILLSGSLINHYK